THKNTQKHTKTHKNTQKHNDDIITNRPRSRRPKKTTPQEDRFLTLSALRNRRQYSTDLLSRFAGPYGRWLSTQTMRIRLLVCHRAARRPAMTALHCQAHLRWCRQLLHWNLNLWRNVIRLHRVINKASSDLLSSCMK
uniref:Transposase Tc1-like domain-containing protein n=1 Tax=Labrus bergylta TaxID=56723 RepID=A0A3Q3F080_9LABR